MKFPYKTAARLSIVAGILLSGCGVKEGDTVTPRNITATGIRPGYGEKCTFSGLGTVKRKTEVCYFGTADHCEPAVEVKNCVVREELIEKYDSEESTNTTRRR